MLSRPITPDDIPWVVGLAREMHGESPIYRTYAFDPAKIEAICANALTNPDWFCAVIEADDARVVGFVAAICVPSLFGHDRFVEDFGLYVTPLFRGTSAALRLLGLLESWARGIGARQVRLGVTTGTNPEAVERFLLRVGYGLSGRLYTKPICPLSEADG